MPGFDITSILDFKPPSYICPNCRGLFSRFKYVKVDPDDPWGGVNRTFCDAGQCEFVLGEFAPEYGAIPQWLKSEGLTIAHGQDLFEHARSFAMLVSQAKGSQWSGPWPTMRLFFETLSRAKHFVHFASWGISHLMIGALKLTSMRVPVLGFVSNVEEHARVELEEFPLEAPNLTAKAIPQRQGAWDAPHQKLIVVDGLIAFTGSTNLTNNAIRKADRGLDITEVVTDIEKVTQLNNRYFSPVWKNLVNPANDVIEAWGPPF